MNFNVLIFLQSKKYDCRKKKSKTMAEIIKNVGGSFFYKSYIGIKVNARISMFVAYLYDVQICCWRQVCFSFTYVCK